MADSKYIFLLHIVAIAWAHPTDDADKKDFHQARLVAAIDIGTTFSRWAYQFDSDYSTHPLQVRTMNRIENPYRPYQVPTALLISPDGRTLKAFGYEAEVTYAELVANNEHEIWYYFRNFKTQLYGVETITRNMTIVSENGNKLPALAVFTHAISSLKRDVEKSVQSVHMDINLIKDDDVWWVLTAPAVWCDGAKSLLREAGRKAGISTERLLVALEPEVTAIYSKQEFLDKQNAVERFAETTISPGMKYLTLDAGGGSVGINVHEVLNNGNLRELYKPTGGNWGGNEVNEAFQQFLIELCGQDVMAKFQKNHINDYFDLFVLFEVEKRVMSEKNYVMTTIPLPESLLDELEKSTGKSLGDIVLMSRVGSNVSVTEKGKLKVNAAVMKSFYTDSIKHITAQIESIRNDKLVSDCQTVIMAGGYSASTLLREGIKRTFPKMQFITPMVPSLIGVKGAVLYARKQKMVSSRILKYTYGIKDEREYDLKIHPESMMFVNKNGKEMVSIFHKIPKVQQEVTPFERYNVSYDNEVCITDERSTATVELYASSDKEPKYINEPGCFMVGRFRINCRDKNGVISKVAKQFIFGSPEIELLTVLETTGEETRNIMLLL